MDTGPATRSENVYVMPHIMVAPPATNAVPITSTILIAHVCGIFSFFFFMCC